MSSAYLICYGDRVPTDTHAVPALLAELIGEANAEAARCGWVGTAFSRFSSSEGYLQFDLVPGDAPATIEDLRRFREAQRVERAAALARQTEEPEQPVQSGLFDGSPTLSKDADHG